MSRPAFAFDPDTHTYTINGRPVPSVTQVMADVIPGWHASDWYLQRGRAVHACAAMIAQGLEFEHDDRISGQVAACRNFLNAWGISNPSHVEFPVFSGTYCYAGTLDLVDKNIIVDYKATLTDAVPIQIAGYAIAFNRENEYRQTCRGLGVQLNEDGTYKCSEVYDLRRYKAEWLGILSTYNVRRRLKIKEEACQQS